MIPFTAVVSFVAGLQPDDLRRWIDNRWVRPLGEPGAWHFEEIDVARVRLIVELRQDLHVEEETVPVVLSLLDQLHAMRRQIVTLRTAIEQTVPADMRDSLLTVLRRVDTGG